MFEVIQRDSVSILEVKVSESIAEDSKAFFYIGCYDFNALLKVRVVLHPLQSCLSFGSIDRWLALSLAVSLVLIYLQANRCANLMGDISVRRHLVTK